MSISSYQMVVLFVLCFVSVHQTTYIDDLTFTQDVCNNQQLSFTKSKNVCERIVRPALTKSLFPNIPPTINFVPEGEEDLPDWLGSWTKFVGQKDFSELRDYQKLNHFYGTFQLFDKNKMVSSISRMQVRFGREEFGFYPQTYVIPKDLPDIKRAFDEGGADQLWIIKPPLACQGAGIEVISEFTEIPRMKNWVVQRYITNPYLINDLKFDLRIHVYVSSYDPLRIYVSEHGLARFTTVKYSTSPESLKNRLIHLTNPIINKENADFQVNDSDTASQGHQWSLTALWNYLERQGINTAPIWDKIVDIIIKTLISVDTPVNHLTKANNISRYSMHELIGFDILLDDHLHLWVLEVNRLPGLLNDSNLAYNMNSRLIVQLLNTAGFRLPDEDDIVDKYPYKLSHQNLSNYNPPNNVCNDKRLFNQLLSEDEEAKHKFYTKRHNDKQLAQSILDTLTPADIRILTETIDEKSRSVGLQRIFPTPFTHKYLKYFDTPRYYNLLLNQWVQQYNHNENKGNAILQALCEERIHLNSRKNKHKNKWYPPRVSYSYRGFQTK